MEIFMDCLPCTLRQLLDAARMATDDTQLHSVIMDEGIAKLQEHKHYRNSPEFARAMQRIVAAHTGVTDPYQEVKRRDIEAALSLYPMLKEYAAEGDRLHRALKVSATGNVIDSAVSSHHDITAVIQKELHRPFAIFDEPALRKKLKTAKTMMFVGDNAGETVFDRVLLETLSPLEITFATRGGPALNDSTLPDALASGLGECAHVISTGCNIAGVNMDETSEEFRRNFFEADIVICKGQGNFETLSETGRDVFFLLKAKCVVLSRLLQVDAGDYVFKYCP